MTFERLEALLGWNNSLIPASVAIFIECIVTLAKQDLGSGLGFLYIFFGGGGGGGGVYYNTSGQGLAPGGITCEGTLVGSG